MAVAHVRWVPLLLAVGLCGAPVGLCKAQTPAAAAPDSADIETRMLSGDICAETPSPAPDSMRLGRVVGVSRVRFRYSVPAKCAPDEHGCIGKDSVSSGELVVVYQRFKGFICAEALPNVRALRDREGWLPEDRVRLESSLPPPTK
jgi:hypothetical protein